MADSGEYDRLRRRQVLYYVALAEACEHEDRFAVHAPRHALLAAEHENLAAALGWSLAHPPMADASLRLAVAVAQFWRERGQWTEYRAWLVQALAQVAGSPATRTQAMAYIRLGDFAWSQNDFAAARTALETSLHLWQQLGDSEGTARVLASLGLWAREQGDTERAVELLEQSAALYRELDKPVWIAWALCCMGEALVMQGDIERAAAVLGESLALYRSLDYKLGVAWTLNHLGHLAQWHGEYARATSLHQESLALFRHVFSCFLRRQRLSMVFAGTAHVWGALLPMASADR